MLMEAVCDGFSLIRGLPTLGCDMRPVEVSIILNVLVINQGCF